MQPGPEFEISRADLEIIAKKLLTNDTQQNST